MMLRCKWKKHQFCGLFVLVRQTSTDGLLEWAHIFFWRDPIDLKFYSLIQRVFLMRLEHSDLINVTGGFVLYRYTRGYIMMLQCKWQKHQFCGVWCLSDRHLLVSWNGRIFFLHDPIDLKFSSLIQRVFLMRLKHSDFLITNIHLVN